MFIICSLKSSWSRISLFRISSASVSGLIRGCEGEEGKVDAKFQIRCKGTTKYWNMQIKMSFWQKNKEKCVGACVYGKKAVNLQRIL